MSVTVRCCDVIFVTVQLADFRSEDSTVEMKS